MGSDERKPTLPTERDFRRYLKETEHGRMLLDIFDNYSAGLDLGYETEMDDRDPKDLNYVGERASLHVNDPFVGDENGGSSFRLSVWLEDNSACLSFNLYAVGGAEPQIALEVDLDTGEPIIEYEGEGVNQEEYIAELPKVLDRIRRLSRVRGAVLDLVNREGEI